MKNIKVEQPRKKVILLKTLEPQENQKIENIKSLITNERNKQLPILKLTESFRK